MRYFQEMSIALYYGCMKSDELLREGYSLFPAECDESSDLLVLVFFCNEKDPEDNVRATELVENDMRKYVVAHPERKYKILVDVAQFTDLSEQVLTPHTKEIYARIVKQPQILKVAVLGASTHIEGFVTHILSLIGGFEGKLQRFDSVSAAHEWLSE